MIVSPYHCLKVPPTPDWTPWGVPDLAVGTGIPGLTFYGTPSHGGYYLRPGSPAEARVPEPARIVDGWYEEDAEWAILGYYLPEAFPHPAGAAALRCYARQVIRACDYLRAGWEAAEEDATEAAVEVFERRAEGGRR